MITRTPENQQTKNHKSKRKSKCGMREAEIASIRHYEAYSITAYRAPFGQMTATVIILKSKCMTENGIEEEYERSQR